MRDWHLRGIRALCATLAVICSLGLGVMPPSVAAAAPAPDPATSGISANLTAAHLPEPLVATGPTMPAEDAALLAAVTRHQNRIDPDDFSALTGFLAAHPKSAWRVAVSTNLGIVHLHYGYFSRALAAFAAAWRDGRDATLPRARALVDRAVGELVQMHAEFGHKDELAALLKEIGNRPLG